MKTSAIIITALLLNTTLLVAAVLSIFMNGINPFILLSIEVFLVAVYFLNKWLKDLNKAYTMDLVYLDTFVSQAPKK